MKSRSNTTGQELTIETRRFPVISDQSIVFSATGQLSQCRLYSRNVLLSVINEFSAAKTFGEPASSIDFLGAPFHAGLCSDIFVEIDYTDNNIPSLIITECGALNWTTVGNHEYKETVVVGSNSGPKKVIICYGRDYIGFVAQ